MNPNETYFASILVIEKYNPADTWDDGMRQPISRAYDFRMNDERKVGKRAAFARAQERAQERRRVQQITLIEGPLLGQTMWLIQDNGDLLSSWGANNEVKYDTRLLEPEVEIETERAFKVGDIIEDRETLRTLPTGTVIAAESPSLSGRRRTVVETDKGRRYQLDGYSHGSPEMFLSLPYRIISLPGLPVEIDFQMNPEPEQRPVVVTIPAKPTLRGLRSVVEMTSYLDGDAPVHFVRIDQ